MSAAPDRAAWVAGMRQVLEAMEAHPELPVPYIGPQDVDFHVDGSYGPDPRREFAAIEETLTAALGVTFAALTESLTSGSVSYYVLAATLDGGLRVTVKAWATAVAEERVTGQVTADIKEWVRLPVEDEEAVEDDGSEEDEA